MFSELSNHAGMTMLVMAGHGQCLFFVVCDGQVRQWVSLVWNDCYDKKRCVNDV